MTQKPASTPLVLFSVLMADKPRHAILNSGCIVRGYLPDATIGFGKPRGERTGSGL